MKHLMIDIETLSTQSNALIMQIGGVYFDIETGLTGERFCKSLNIAKLRETNAFHECDETLNWWKQQDQEVYENIIMTAEDPTDVMKEYTDFIQKAEYFWSHATFDFVILNNCLKQFNQPLMHFHRAMDIRTLCFLSQIDLSLYNWDENTHDALSDCIFQIKYCSYAYKKIIEND